MSEDGVEDVGLTTFGQGENSTLFRVPVPDEGGKDAGESSGVLIIGLKGIGRELRPRWLVVGGLGGRTSGTDILPVRYCRLAVL